MTTEEEFDENDLLLGGEATTVSVEEFRAMKKMMKEYTERIKVLEDVSTHFANEFKIMKKLITAHVHEVNNNIDNKFKEMNKIVDSKLEKIEGRLDTAFQKLESTSEELNKSQHRKSNNSSFQTPRKSNDSLLQMFSPIERSTGKKVTSVKKPTIIEEEAPLEEVDYTEEMIEGVLSSEVFEPQQGM